MFKVAEVPAGYFFIQSCVECVVNGELNSLPAIDAHEHQLINKLCARVVSPRIFVRC